jgi:hypothetical protein
LNSNIIPNRIKIDYIKKRIRYYIIIILNIMGVKLDVDIADCQDYNNLGNIRNRGGYSTKTVRYDRTGNR